MDSVDVLMMSENNMTQLVQSTSEESNKKIITENDVIDEEFKSFDLSLDSVVFKGYHKLSKASIGQIMVAFRNVLRVKPRTGNEYEEALYAKLKPAVSEFVNAYCEILKCNNDIENVVKHHNLIINMPIAVSIFKDEHGEINIGKPKIGALIKACKQRIRFIIEREPPQMYIDDENKGFLLEFKKMQSQLKNFENDLLLFESEFICAVDDAYKARNNSTYN